MKQMHAKKVTIRAIPGKKKKGKSKIGSIQQNHRNYALRKQKRANITKKTANRNLKDSAVLR